MFNATWEVSEQKYPDSQFEPEIHAPLFAILPNGPVVEKSEVRIQ